MTSVALRQLPQSPQYLLNGLLNKAAMVGYVWICFIKAMELCH